MIWLNNLESISVSKMSGICPHCKSEDTEYTFCGDVGEIGYGVVWCNNCKSAYHISRIMLEEGHPLNKNIPEGLQYI